ncbi:hypothetical protein FHS86_000278 [Roseimarinus sediminis]
MKINKKAIIESLSSLKLFFLLLLLTAFTSVHAIEKTFQENLVDQQLLLEFPVEFHLTGSNDVMTNSSVSLNHSDAWLFFDNIKPSLVANNYLSKIQVNGVPFQNGVNGRMAIYAHGTVLIPHPSGFKPLTIYSESNFGGDSMQLSIHTYHNQLGNFNNSIRSFKLKRGYMATLATKADGLGYSRVFIADEEDLELAAMPLELDSTVSFIRIFNHQWVTKKGWAGWNWDEYQMVNATWYYDWSAGGSTSENLEYAVIKQNGGWPSWSDINNKQNVSHLLGFNEPDRPDQANMEFETALKAWPEYMKSGLRLGSPATSDPFNNWSLINFIDRCDELNYRVDFVAVHAYWAKSPQQWYNDLKYIHERTGRPIWITEWNNGANWTNEWWPDDPSQLTTANAQKQLNDIKAILNVLDTAHFVERYSIYNWVEDARAMVLNGQLTPAGEYYASNPSKIAYNKINEVIPGPWNFADPVLNYRYLTFSNTIRLSWENPNEDLSRSYTIEKRVNDGEFKVIYSSTNLAENSFVDQLDSTLSGRIEYRLSLATPYGDEVNSNTVAYYQSGGDQTFQYGNFLLNNTDWNSFLFSPQYENTPLVINGIPSFNNVVALTHRVNAITGKSFKFQFDAWNYLNNPPLKKDDVIAMLALPEGIYNMGALKAEARKELNVDENWKYIAFEQSFDEVPAVFANQVSNNTYFPTVVAIQNVSTSGFEVRLKCEEAISEVTIGSEAISFLAIEPGVGAMGPNRILVGRTSEGQNGISSNPVTINTPGDFTTPAIWSALQSAEDDFASTLRFTKDESNYTVLKHREMSGKITAIKEDKLGWMIMDLAPGQELSASRQFNLKQVNIYPNPGKNIVYLNLKESSDAVLYDLSGRIVLKAKIKQELNIAHLKAGSYLLKIEGYAPRRIVKK